MSNGPDRIIRMPGNQQTIIHCPKCAGRNLFWLTPKNFRCADCSFVLFLNIAAAVAVIIECNGRILFGLRQHDPGEGMLDLPGGFVDQGESAEDGARREVLEETGIKLQQLQYLLSLPNIYPYRELTYDTLDLIFFCHLAAPPPMQAGDDLAQLLWIERDKIDFDRIAFTSLRQAVRRYLENGKKQGCHSMG